jgi:uncharacterized protein (TIGR02466 family)
MIVIDYNLNKYICFPSSIYTMMRPNYLEIVKQISDKNLVTAKLKEKNKTYPAYMSDNFFDDPSLTEFNQLVLQISWSILKDQGYFMEDKETSFTEMWTQEHHKHSLMEQHIHKFGCQIVGFYFLETPKNCSKLLVHDPRPAKTVLGLEEVNTEDATEASDIVNIIPEPGLLVFTNGWLPHSFGRHENNKPIKFVHFNVNVSKKRDVNTYEAPLAEII